MILHLLDSLNRYGVVLASSSPRRREILMQTGLSFTVVASRFDESSLDKSKFAGAQDYVVVNAGHKALEVAQRLQADASSAARIVIGVDTVVVAPDGRRILEKPHDAAEALAMLRLLSGQTHSVVSGVTVLYRPAAATVGSAFEVFRQFHRTTRVSFAELSEAELQAYVATGEPFDKAGGYGIQARAGLFVKQLDGDYYNVVGLPLHSLAEVLAELAAVLR